MAHAPWAAVDALVIANPRAGSSRFAGQLALLAQRELGWEWRWTNNPGEASRLARDAVLHGRTHLIAAGGDGTVHHIVKGMMAARERPILGVLPIGTGNDLARTLGMSTDPLEALHELASQSRVRRVDLGVARIGRHRRFLVNASAAGFSGEVNRVVDREGKARWGALAYVIGALEIIGDPPVYDIALRIDGRLVNYAECIGLIVTNGRTCGGGLRVAPTADPEDGQLDVLLVERAARLTLVAIAARLRTTGVISHPSASHYVGAEIAVDSDRPMPFNVDGELIDDVRHARFETLPGALRVLTGPGYQRDIDMMRRLA
jgi:diacylglycerol kinase (ATP)